MGKDKSPEDLVKEKSFEYYKVENELQRKFVKQLEYNGFRKKEYYSKITNDFKYVTVCNYNDVEFELFDSKKYSQIYSEEDIDAIYKKLQELKKPEKEYELDIDVEGLIASTPKFVAGLKCLT